jgi:hypothetical protein
MVIGVKVEEALAFKTGVPAADVQVAKAVTKRVYIVVGFMLKIGRLNG